MSSLGGVHGIILAGTSPAQGAPVDAQIKGPFAPVAQKPLISYALRWFRSGGISRATICVNGATRLLRESLGDGAACGLQLDYYQDRTPRGPAGCVRDAGLAAGARTLVVAEGALIPTVSIPELLQAHLDSGAVLTVVVDRDRRRQPMGVERPPSPAGVYVFDTSALGGIPSHGFQDIKERLIPRLYREGQSVRLHAVPGLSTRIVSQEAYLAINERMVKSTTETAGALEHGYSRWEAPELGDGDVVLHATAQISPEARLLGPLVVGPGVRVDAGATVIGPASLGSGSTIGEGALVSRSVLWSRCRIGADAVVDRGLLTDDAVVAPGEMLFNTARLRRERRGLGWLRIPSLAEAWRELGWLQAQQRRTQV